MKIYLAVFVLLVSTHLVLCNGDQSVLSGRVARDVAEVLAGIFSKDKVETRDLTASKKFVAQLQFDKFKETLFWRIKRGIPLANYPTVINNFSMRFSVPAHIKESILDGQYAEDMVEIIQNFKYENGKTGNLIYGGVAIVKHDNKIDVAYYIYNLEFKLSPLVIKHKRKRRILGITVRSRTR